MLRTLTRLAFLASWCFTAAFPAWAQTADQEVRLTYAGCSWFHTRRPNVESIDVTHAVFESCTNGAVQGWMVFGFNTQVRSATGGGVIEAVRAGWMRDGHFVGSRVDLLEIGAIVGTQARSRAVTFPRVHPNYTLNAVLDSVRDEAQASGAPNQEEAVRAMSAAVRSWEVNPKAFMELYLKPMQDDRLTRGRSAKGR
jgi:hypothetical protein